jgi:hypothetical protein
MKYCDWSVALSLSALNRRMAHHWQVNPDHYLAALERLGEIEAFSLFK